MGELTSDPLASVCLSVEWVFCGLGFSFGAAGREDVRAGVGALGEGLTSFEQRPAFLQKANSGLQGSGKD